MKTLFICLITAIASNFVTFSKWECSITIGTYKDGSVDYTAHYKGKSYPLTFDQYTDLMNGKDLTFKVAE